MVAGMMSVFIHVLLCASLAVVVLRDFSGAIRLALAALLPGSDKQRAAPSADPRADEEAACGRHLAALARLRRSLKGAAECQAAAAALEAIREALALAGLLGAGDDRADARRELFGAAEAALQALDPADGRARRAAAELLGELREQEVLADWQLDRLHDALEVRLELDAVMGSALSAGYEKLPFVQAERAGDHRLADLGSLLEDEYDTMHSEERSLDAAY